MARRADGYHDLQTIFYPIPLCDTLHCEEDYEDNLEIDGIALDGNWQDNLVMKALRALRAAGYNVPPQQVRLHKGIPCGAGLGGGSSDAAFMVRMMNETYHLGMSDAQMEALLAPLGADCPFFVRQKPVYAEGIGNIFSPTDLDLTGWHIALVKPNDHIATREAYAGIHPCPAAFELKNITALPVEQWEGKVVNDFERSVLPAHPAVEAIKQKLYEMGSKYACMSGSGSSVFGLFRTPVADLEKEFEGYFTFQCKL